MFPSSHSSPGRPPRWGFTQGLCLALSCALLALGALNLGESLLGAHPDPGARLVDGAGGVRVLDLVAEGAAERSGVKTGDRILAVAGAPAVGAVETADRLWRLPAGTPVPLEVERNGERLMLAFAAPRLAPPLHPRLYLWLVGLAFLVSGTVLILQCRRSGLYPYYFLCLAAWSVLALSHTGRATGFDWTIYWLDTAARCAAPALALHCALLYPRPLSSRRARMGASALAYSGSAALLTLSIGLVGAGVAYRFADPVGALEAADRLHLLFLSLGLGAAALAVAAHRTGSRDRLELRELRWVEWGIAGSLAPFVLFYLLPSGLGFPPGPLQSLALLPLGLLPISCSVALARRRLADLEVRVKRGVVLAANALAIVVCYLGVYVALRAVAGGWSGLPAEIPMLLAAIAAAALYPGLRERIHARVDRLFYLDKYDYRKTLIQFSRELNSERDSAAVLDRFLDRVVQTLEVVRAALLVRDENGALARRAEHPREPAGAPMPTLRAGDPLGLQLCTLDQLSLVEGDCPPAARGWLDAGFEVLLPMKVKGELVALLAVGPRADGAALTREDLQLLVTVSGHAALAVEGARLYGEIRHKVEELDKLRALSDGVLQSSRVGILVVGPGGTISRANEAAEMLFGVPLVGASARERLPRVVLDLITEHGREAHEGVRRLYRLPVRSPGGSRTVNVTLAPLRGPGVEADARVVTLDDVTERVELEEKLVQNERLASIGLLAAGVAHEVNTPLTGICSYIQMLLEDATGDDRRAGILRKVEKQAFRASDIVNSLLNFSRGGDQAFHPTDLNSAVEEALSLFEPHLKNTHIQVERDLDPALPSVPGIRRELQQVVVNLLLNARDAMPRGGSIRLSTRATPSGVELSITDTGRGIPPENLQRIYDPFFTTKGVGRGTGLGLSVTYGIVRKHSGSIDVDSAAERGTTFTIALPVLEDTAQVVTH